PIPLARRASRKACTACAFVPPPASVAAYSLLPTLLSTRLEILMLRFSSPVSIGAFRSAAARIGSPALIKARRSVFLAVALVSSPSARSSSFRPSTLTRAALTIRHPGLNQHLQEAPALPRLTRL